MKTMPQTALIVIGASTGGIDALMKLLPALSSQAECPILVAQHVLAEGSSCFSDLLTPVCQKAIVKEAEERTLIQDKFIYIAPADYHVLVEANHTISLSKDDKVNFSRPSIDVLFESAADVYGDQVVGILLTGASDDGAKGMAKIHQYGGATIVQNINEAKMPTMPQSAIELGVVDFELTLAEIPAVVRKLIESNVEINKGSIDE